MEYLPRSLDRQLDELMSYEAAVAIDGPKGVGKTATASRRAVRRWSMDRESDRTAVQADPDFEDAPGGTLLIDEWQHHQPAWNHIRHLVDDGAPPGRFLLAGSATPRPGQGTHSGAGRIASARMRPLALYERNFVAPTVSLSKLLAGEQQKISGESPLSAGGYYQAIVKSGFPDIHHLPERQAQRRLSTYLQRVIDRDLLERGYTVRRPDTLRAWMAAYAAATATTSSYSNVLDAAVPESGNKPARSTTNAYRDHLSQLWLLDPIYSWQPVLNNPFKWLMRAPKHHLADPALAARLLDLNSASLSSGRGAAMAGPLFESLATLTLRVASEAADARVGHLRTKNGDREVDLVVEGFNGEILGIEVKLSAHVSDQHVRHLLWMREQLGERVSDLVILYSGKQAYRRRDGVAVIPLALLGE